MSAQMTSDDAVFAHFSHLLATAGLRPALIYLLGLTTYRFVSIFRFADGMATAAAHYDRDNPAITRTAEVQEATTYCCFVKDSRSAFVTADAACDARLVNHPSRSSVLAYCGIPVMDSAGNLLGSLCFYDVVARDPAQLDLALLMRIASALAYGGHVPPYPCTDPVTTTG
jgi:GAF domain-containing protein